jgi:hypothetical protein
MNQLTLRRIPVRLDRALRQVSAQRSQSLNTTIIETLSKGLGVEEGRRKRRDLGRYAGTWTPEEHAQFEKSCEVFEQIDLEVWKQ